MLQYSTVQIKDSITTKVLKIVFSIYLLVAVTVTVIHMLAEYYNTKGEVAAELEVFHNTFARGLATALWYTDDKQIRSILQGIVEVPIIVGVRIDDAEGTNLYNQGVIINREGKTILTNEKGDPTSGTDTGTGLFWGQFDVNYPGGEGITETWKMTLYSNTEVVVERVQYGFILIAINAVIKTVALWAIFLLVGQVLLSHPLAKLSFAVQQLTMSNLDNFQVDVGVTGKNELKILEDAFNAMVQNLKQSRQELEKAKHQLDLQKLDHQHREFADLAKSANLDRGNLEGALQEITSFARRNMKVARAGVWRYNDDHTELKCLYMQLLGNTNDPPKEIWKVSRLPSYFEALSRERILAIPDAQTNPITLELGSAYLHPQKIGAMINAPVFLQGQAVGFLSAEHVGEPRTWTVDELKVMKNLSQLVAVAIESQHRKHAEDQADENHRQIEEIVNQRTAELQEALKASQAKEQETEAQKVCLENLSQKLARYLAPQLYEAIVSEKIEIERISSNKTLTFLICSVGGLTAALKDMETGILAEWLNDYLSRMIRIVDRYGGTIDKFVGDEIIVFFGDSMTNGMQEDAMACVQMAMEMRREMDALQTAWSKRGVPEELHIRIGIHTGECAVGSFGSENRLDYTIIGHEVNLTHSLERHADPGAILISEKIYELVHKQFACKPQDSIQVLGSETLVKAYQVID